MGAARTARPDGGRSEAAAPQRVEGVRSLAGGRIVMSNGEVHVDRNVALGVVGVALGLGVVAGLVVAR